jgi:hypothetical protein
MVSEKEAKTKLCPMINSNCVGSQCMMWQWGSRSPEWIKHGQNSKSFESVKIHSQPTTGSCQLKL